jgi:hypothetical protein
MFQTKAVKKIKTYFVFYSFFFENFAVRKILCKNIIELDRPRMTGRMRFACWIIKLYTHTQNMLYLLFFHTNNGCRNAPRCCVICTLPVLLNFFSLYCRGVGYSPASHNGGPDLILQQTHWVLWWTKWHWDRFFSWLLWFSAVRIILSMILIVYHYHLHLRATLTRRTTGRTLRTFKSESIR